MQIYESATRFTEIGAGVGLWLRTFRYMSSADFLSENFKDDLEKIADRALTTDLSELIILRVRFSIFPFRFFEYLFFLLRFHRSLPDSWNLKDSSHSVLLFDSYFNCLFQRKKALIFYFHPRSVDARDNHFIPSSLASDMIAPFLTYNPSGAA